VLEAGIEKLLDGISKQKIKPIEGSFFLSTKEEARLELMGTVAMYKNLDKAGELPMVHTHPHPHNTQHTKHNTIRTVSWHQIVRKKIP